MLYIQEENGDRGQLQSRIVLGVDFNIREDEECLDLVTPRKTELDLSDDSATYEYEVNKMTIKGRIFKAKGRAKRYHQYKKLVTVKRFLKTDFERTLEECNENRNKWKLIQENM